jgi:hypothetical protein
MKIFHPMLLLAATLLAVGPACTASGGGGASPTVSITQEVTLTATMPAVSETVTPIPTPTRIRAFFTEEFDKGYPVNHWQVFNLGRGQMGNLAVQQQDDHLLFDLTDEDVYVYYMFTPYTYTNVSISLEAENLGSNNNNVSLVCRMNSDASKWYEFSVTNSGLWNLFAVDNGMYHIIGSGGTNFLKLGQETNEYQMICNGTQIRMLINGNEVKTITDGKYGFNEGFVGFNVSSLKGYSVLPITVAVDSFAIDHP